MAIRRALGPATAAVVLGLAGCASHPAGWREACRTEATAARFESLPPSGLALPRTGLLLDHSRVLRLLAAHGADWVEIPVWPEDVAAEERSGAARGLFAEGPGLYALRLTRLSEPDCQNALYRHWLAPDGFTRIERTADAQDRTGVRPSLSTCLSARKSGQVPERLSPLTEQPPLSWTAPYVVEQVRFPTRLAPPDSGVAVEVRRRDDGKVVWRSVNLVARTDRGWFPAIATCRPDTAPAIFGPDRTVAPVSTGVSAIGW